MRNCFRERKEVSNLNIVFVRNDNVTGGTGRSSILREVQLWFHYKKMFKNQSLSPYLPIFLQSQKYLIGGLWAVPPLTPSLEKSLNNVNSITINGFG